MSTVTATINTVEKDTGTGPIFAHFDITLRVFGSGAAVGDTVSTTATTAVFDDVEDGTYYVAVREIAADGGNIGSDIMSDPFVVGEGDPPPSGSTYQGAASVSVVVS